MCELVIICLLWCSVCPLLDDLQIILKWSPDDYLPLLMAHRLPLAPNKGSFWRLVKGEDGGVFLKMQEGSHWSTTAGAMQMKSKVSCRKMLESNGIRIKIMCGVKSHLQISGHLFEHMTQCSLVSQLCVQYLGYGDRLGSVHTSWSFFVDKFHNGNCQSTA